MALSDELNQLATAVAGAGTAIHNKDSAEAIARANADTAEQTARQNADTALNALIGSDRGLIAIKTAAQALPADPWGFVFQTDSANTTGVLATTLPTPSASAIGKRMTFENTSAYNWTLSSTNIVSSQSNGATTLVLAPGSNATVYCDGSSYLVEAGTYAVGGSGKNTVSAAAPSGGSNGDTWFQV